MPYLHFETNQRCLEMKEAIKSAEWMRTPERPRLLQAKNCDEMLIRAHLATSTVSLHVRRTLDQSFYHNIDTQYRDQDQVVFRYQTKDHPSEEDDPKLVMVDQMWMWVLGKNLVVTAFPQRWQQPKNDPLNVLDSIIEDINDKSREPVQSVYDLAMIVTSRCSGVFDRHRMGDEDYQFLDMFESSIGNATDKETKLFQEFNDASAQASAWLQHRNPNRNISKDMQQVSRIHNNEEDVPERKDDLDAEEFMRGPVFIDKLLDIGQETDLLAETKDIRDELNMIKKVLEDQQYVLPLLETSICEIYKEEQRSQQAVKKRFENQIRLVGMHVKDIDRMDKQAERIYSSITDMLDLKQKHANAFEARFARDQATSTARQSQTIMVFTIVTIIFLPMSFIAAFFTINIQEFPRVDGNNLPLAYVSKYMFGIGLSISIPMIFIAFYLEEIGGLAKNTRNGIKQWRRRKREKEEFDDDGTDENTIRLEQVLSEARSTRKSADTWMRDRRSMSARPGTAGSVVREKPTGFRMRMSGDVERGLR